MGFGGRAYAPCTNSLETAVKHFVPKGSCSNVAWLIYLENSAYVPTLGPRHVPYIVTLTSTLLVCSDPPHRSGNLAVPGDFVLARWQSGRLLHDQAVPG